MVWHKQYKENLRLKPNLAKAVQSPSLTPNLKKLKEERLIIKNTNDRLITLKRVVNKQILNEINKLYFINLRSFVNTEKNYTYVVRNYIPGRWATYNCPRFLHNKIRSILFLSYQYIYLLWNLTEYLKIEGFPNEDLVFEMDYLYKKLKKFKLNILADKILDTGYTVNQN